MTSIISPRRSASSLFQSTPPARGATKIVETDSLYELFQSTPPARGATVDLRIAQCIFIISIHAPREGGDNMVVAAGQQGIEISIHAPREGGDAGMPEKCKQLFIFQSTPPARGATFKYLIIKSVAHDFNPRPPRGGRPRLCRKCFNSTKDFNPRPPRGGRPLLPVRQKPEI